MSQKSTLQNMDALMFAAFAGAGIADAATYQNPAGQPVPCTALLDEGVQDYGDDDAPVSAPYDRVTLQLREVEPRIGGIVRITGTGARLKLEKRLRGDASSQQWVVLHV
ncbi:MULTISPECIES: hypothetical protein [unclassified Stenotrophomonas]|uniref:head-tail joining protein n=1 Tax=unclassified Stenotrophomonas TaxID=196198 RepID=UPI0021177876|nr:MULTISPECIES: hypothetical protein [unclassified Stenotrophomonas]